MHLPDYCVLERDRIQKKVELSVHAPSAELLPAVRAGLLDPAGWRDGLETFARATNLAVALVDAEGRLLGDYFNLRPTWHLLHDKSPAAIERCPFVLGSNQPCTCVADVLAGGGFVVERDPTGLVHFAVPLQIGEHRLGALVAGQVFDQYPEQLPLERVASAFGLPPHKVWQLARREQPVKKDILRVYADLLATLGQTFLLARYQAASEAEHAEQVTQLSNRLAEAERRNEVLAMLPHTLRAPLTPVQNALELMRLCPADRLACARARDIASQQTQHLSRQIDDLVDVSRISHGRIRLRKEIVELAHIVNQAVDTIRDPLDIHGQKLTISLPLEPVRLNADPARLVQVLSNMLNNATKYTPDGGRIWLTAECDEQEIVLRVRDTGIGMGPELLPHVFDLFTRGERGLDQLQGGLGIGLTTVRSLVEMHGGSVVCRSQGHDCGSEFVVRLPIVAQTTQRLESPAEYQQEAPGRPF